MSNFPNVTCWNWDLNPGSLPPGPMLSAMRWNCLITASLPFSWVIVKDNLCFPSLFSVKFSAQGSSSLKGCLCPFQHHPICSLLSFLGTFFRPAAGFFLTARASEVCSHSPAGRWECSRLMYRRRSSLQRKDVTLFKDGIIHLSIPCLKAQHYSPLSSGHLSWV